jgi:hypothetical protein
MGGLRAATRPETEDCSGLGFPGSESAAWAWESFARIACTSAGVVTALSDLVQVGGPFPARLFRFNPARPYCSHTVITGR